MIRIAAALAVIVFATALAALLCTAALAADSLETEIDRFIAADGFAPADLAALETSLQAQFFDIGEIAPGGSVGPIEKALLIATGAIPSTRTRTALAYGEIVTEAEGPVSFIELRHYNLGPAIRAETIAEFGEGDVADEAAFGLGDHMAWRFVFQPLMGNAAALVAASSRVISDKSAAKQDCDTQSCLATAPALEADAAWEPLAGDLPAWPPLYAERSGTSLTPAYAIARLAVLGFWANAESGRYQWTGGEHPEAARGATPYRFITIERNLGQEDGIDAAWRETLLNDDALQAIAFRQTDIAGQLRFERSATSR